MISAKCPVDEQKFVYDYAELTFEDEMRTVFGYKISAAGEITAVGNTKENVFFSALVPSGIQLKCVPKSSLGKFCY